MLLQFCERRCRARNAVYFSALAALAVAADYWVVPTNQVSKRALNSAMCVPYVRHCKAVKPKTVFSVFSSELDISESRPISFFWQVFFASFWNNNIVCFLILLSMHHFNVYKVNQACWNVSANSVATVFYNDNNSDG